MVDDTSIRDTAERNVRTLGRKPARGHLTGVTTARIADGLRCEIEEGPWKLATDMPPAAGGAGTAPTPGVLGRGALASCLAVGVRTWAARLGIPVQSIEVEVQGDFDARGELGMDDDIRPGYADVRYVVSIESRAAESDVRRLLDAAERYSPYYDVFSRATPVRRHARLNGAEI